jgi:hypothetical protein
MLVLVIVLVLPDPITNTITSESTITSP